MLEAIVKMASSTRCFNVIHHLPLLTSDQARAAAAGGTIPASSRGDLLDEVANLVEAPTVVLGTFSPSFLQLPE
jgi:hypothetical protein